MKQEPTRNQRTQRQYDLLEVWINDPNQIPWSELMKKVILQGYSINTMKILLQTCFPQYVLINDHAVKDPFTMLNRRTA